jgi:hypothetical protein
MVPQPDKGCLFAPVERRTFKRRKLPQPGEVSPPVTSFGQIAFELVMLGTAYRKVRDNAHEAPVENCQGQSSRRANKRQILFSPVVRYQFPGSTPGAKERRSTRPALAGGRAVARSR